MTEAELEVLRAAICREATNQLERSRLLAILRAAAANLINPPERPSEKLQREREAAQELMAAGCTPLTAARKLAADRRNLLWHNVVGVDPGDLRHKPWRPVSRRSPR